MHKKACLLLLFLLTTAIVHSQCTKSSGTPIVNETFGSGTGLGPPLGSGITNMRYVSNTCPNDGEYTITNYTSGCFSVWNTVTDHTGDKDGRFMLINASLAPSDFFVQTVSGLCDGTTYQFSAWIVNMFAVAGAGKPDVSFTIEKTDGTILKTYDSGNIDITNPVAWQQYGFYFTTPAGVSSVVIRMHNNAPGGYGNDLGLDDITFTPAGPETTVGINGTNSNTVHVLCNNSTTLSSSVGNCFVNNGYQWQISTDGNKWDDIAGASNPDYTVNLPATGTYYYRLNVAEGGNIGSLACRSNSNTFTVFYDPPALTNNSGFVCNGGPYQLPSGKIIYTPGVYLDTLRTKAGCDSVIATVNFAIRYDITTFIPSEICEGENYFGYTKTGQYLDTLKAANGCDSIRHLNLLVKPRAHSSISLGICKGDSYLGHTKTGVYVDTLKAANGCDSLATTNLTVYPNIDLGPDKSICAGDSIILNAGTYKSYLWQDNSTASTYKVTAPGTYWVTVTDEKGCMATDTIVIKTITCFNYKIPNTFTPNGDGINDLWVIDGLIGYPECTVSIFSRWGQSVFKSTGYAKPWDGHFNGRELPSGIYYYVINLNNHTKPISGYVTLLK